MNSTPHSFLQLSPPTQIGLSTLPFPVLIKETPTAGGTWLEDMTSSQNALPKGGRTDQRGDARISEEACKGPARRKRPAPLLHPFLSRGGRESLAPFQPAPPPPRRRETLLCHGRRAARPLPVPVPLKLRHPPVTGTTTASNRPF